MVSSFAKLPLLCALLFLAPLGCGPSEVGEECDEVGDTDECVEGAICTNEGDGEEGVCLWMCDDDLDCPISQACNGVSSTNIKSCQPR